MIISQTPFRISFFGGGTDFPEYYRAHGGAVMASSIDKYAYITIHSLGPFFKYCIKANYSRTELADNPENISHPLIRESLLYLNMRESIEIGHVADLPGRTGIGSSSSFTIGLLNALHRLRGDEVNAEVLAREAIEVERERVADAGGHQDQYAAAYGGLNLINFQQDGSIVVTPLSIDNLRLNALEKRLMLFYTGIESSAETILLEQKKRTVSNSIALKEIRGMVDRAVEIVCGKEDISAFGKLLHESWLRKKSLASGISNTLIDDTYATARRAGALGGKLLGAGGRGFLLVYAEPDRQSSLRDALRGLKEVAFTFSSEGSRIIFQNEHE